MAPDLVNTLDHPVRVTDENGQTVRVVPGQVITADGATADRLTAIEGVETATDEHRDAYAASRAPVSDVASAKLGAEQHVSDLRAASRMASTAVPLNQVIGDDDAPLGPPSGTITTKQAVARSGPEQKAAYADHERLPEEAENEKLSEVERAQAEAKGLVEEIHNAALDDAAEAGVEAATTSPTMTSDQSPDGGDSDAPKRSSRKKAEPQPSE